MKVVKDAASVATAGDGLLLIHYDQVWDNGINMGGDLVCASTAAAWLADRIADAASPQGAVKVEQTFGPDHFVVFVGGDEREPNVHVHNYRDPGAPRGKDYTLNGMLVTTATSLVAALRAHQV